MKLIYLIIAYTLHCGCTHANKNYAYINRDAVLMGGIFDPALVKRIDESLPDELKIYGTVRQYNTTIIHEPKSEHNIERIGLTLIIIRKDSAAFIDDLWKKTRIGGGDDIDYITVSINPVTKELVNIFGPQMNMRGFSSLDYFKK